MSLDNISRPGSPIDELVPSRYAQQVGDIEVLVISDGVLPITASTLATNVEPAELAGWLDDNYLPPEVVDWPLNVVVVRSGGRTILVDAGLGVEFPDFPRAGQTVHRLEAAGIDPGSVTDVVLTHLHMDHVGGLLTDGLKARLRPDLQVHVATAEAEFWAAPDFSHTVMPQPIPGVLRTVATRFLDEYRGQLRTFETDHFVSGAKKAHELIVTAYAKGDRETLRPLLNDEVFDAFDHAIKDRQGRGETVKFTLVGYKDAKISHASLKGRMAEITVSFAVQFISSTSNTGGAVIEGDPAAVRDVTDIWTFSRDLRGSDPNWTLVATSGGEF